MNSKWMPLAAAAALAGCATFRSGDTARLNATTQLPSAEGTVTIDEAANDNTALALEVRHLAKPERLDPPASVYVVWTKSGSADPQNVGALQVDDNLNGRLNTVTPHKSFDLFITAEGSGAAQEPSGDRLLWTTINR